jgi:hypothetical protein
MKLWQTALLALIFLVLLLVVAAPALTFGFGTVALTHATAAVIEAGRGWAVVLS